MQVRASSPACRSTDPKALVGNNFARCNFAGPRMENGQLSRCVLSLPAWLPARLPACLYKVNVPLVGLGATPGNPKLLTPSPPCCIGPSIRFCCCSCCCSWWVLDLGPGHQLICNHYTLRHDGSHDFLRSWVLQVRLGAALRGAVC